MESTQQKPKLLTIVGPTASGKSELAIKVAGHFNGEIIAADSRTIYKGMNIGTAKPTPKDQKLVPHWGLDLVEPGQNYSAFQFKKYAQQKITDIQKRGKLPILVGGTGLYIDAVLFDFGFADPADPAQRERLEKISTKDLHELIKQKGYNMPENHQNRRHLIRTIESKGQTGTKKHIDQNYLIIGLMPGDAVLRERINKRANEYFNKDLLDETSMLLSEYGEEALRKTRGIAYIAALELLEGKIDQKQAIEMIQKQEWQYARRQRTWFRRNNFIHWFETPEQAYKEITNILNK
jgi:tRNA dimethylallyltransferase